MAFKGFFPATKPAASPVGLLNSDGVTVVHHTGGDEAWVNGPQSVDNLICQFETQLTDYCSNTTDIVVPHYVSSWDCVTTAYPFGIVTTYETSGVGSTMAERKERVLQAAEVATQRAVEHELWSGNLLQDAGHTDGRYLISPAADDKTNAPVSADRALGALEAALGFCSDGNGVIHMSRDVATLLSYFLKNDNGKITTFLGTPVVVGTGYRGDDPAADAAMIYATGPVTVHLGEVSYIGERIDTATNDIVVMAGQPALVYWDSCCYFSAQVNLTLPLS